MHDATGSRAVGLELFEIEIEILHGVLTNLLAGLAQGLPVQHLVDDAGTLGLNDIGRVTHVSAQLRVPHRDFRGHGEGGRGLRIQGTCAHASTSSSLARISARCRVFTPVC